MKYDNNILIFKAAPDELGNAQNSKDVYQERLESMNLNVRVVNVLTFKYKNLDILTEKLKNPEQFSALVFGSPRCVHAVSKAIDELDSRWKDVPVFAVGETTGRIVNDKLGLKAQGTESGHGAALAPMILQSNLSKPVLMPCGNLSRDTISKILEENGISSDNVEVYETISHPDLENNLKKTIENFIFRIIVYFSPSGISATIPLLKKCSVPLEDIKMVAIGPTTEKALEETGLKVSATASKPTPENLASAISKILI